eukprot:gb/GECG01012767.1/.p1 GENE.gb/GECG01012767.1/~~gb/GECG01012767.1/.p1  ORF type:complete len:1775 (+),score=365.67 gb/GECG01012767.1/:1-5325(+)
MSDPLNRSLDETNLPSTLDRRRHDAGESAHQRPTRSAHVPATFSTSELLHRRKHKDSRSRSISGRALDLKRGDSERFLARWWWDRNMDDAGLLVSENDWEEEEEDDDERVAEAQQKNPQEIYVQEFDLCREELSKIIRDIRVKTQSSDVEQHSLEQSLMHTQELLTKLRNTCMYPDASTNNKAANTLARELYELRKEAYTASSINRWLEDRLFTEASNEIADVRMPQDPGTRLLENIQSLLLEHDMFLKLINSTRATVESSSPGPKGSGSTALRRQKDVFEAVLSMLSSRCFDIYGSEKTTLSVHQEVAELNHQLSLLRESKATLQDRIQSYETNEQDLEERVTEMEVALMNKIVENDDLKTNLEHVRRELENYKHRCITAEQDREKLQKACASKDTELENLRSRVDHNGSMNERLSETLSSIQEQNASLDEEKTRLENEKQQLQDQIRSKEEETKKAKTEYDDAQGQLSQSLEESRAKDLRLQSLGKEMETLKEDLHVKSSECAYKESQLNDLREENQKLNEEMRKRPYDVSDIQAKDEEIALQELEMADLRQQVEAAEERISELKDDVFVRKTENSTLTESLEHCEMNESRLRESVEALETEILELQEKLNEQYRRVEEVVQRSINVEEENERLWLENIAEQDRVSSYQQKLDCLKDNHEKEKLFLLRLSKDLVKDAACTQDTRSPLAADSQVQAISILPDSDTDSRHKVSTGEIEGGVHTLGSNPSSESYRQQLLTSMYEKVQMEDSFYSCESALHEAQGELNETREETSELQRNFEICRKRLEETSQAYSELKKEFDNLRDEYLQTAESLDARNLHVRELQSQLDELQAHKEMTDTRNANLEEYLDEKMEELKLEESERHNLEIKLTGIEDQYETEIELLLREKRKASSDIELLRGALDQEKEKQNMLAEDYQSRVTIYKERVEQARRSEQNTKDERDQYRGAFYELENEIFALGERVHDTLGDEYMRTPNGFSSKQVVELLSFLADELQNEINHRHSLEMSISALESDGRECQEEKERIVQLITEEKDATLERLQAQAHQFDEERGEYNKERHQLHEKINLLREEFEELRTKRKQESEVVSQSLDMSSSEVRELQRQNQELESLLQEAQHKISWRDDNILRLRERIDSIETKLKEEQTTAAELRYRNWELASQLEHLDSLVSDCTYTVTQLHHATNEKEQMERYSSALEEKIKNMANVLDEEFQANLALTQANKQLQKGSAYGRPTVLQRSKNRCREFIPTQIQESAQAGDEKSQLLGMLRNTRKHLAEQQFKETLLKQKLREYKQRISGLRDGRRSTNVGRQHLLGTLRKVPGETVNVSSAEATPGNPKIVKKLESQISELRAELRENENRLRIAEDENASLSSSLRSYKNQVALLQSENERMERMIGNHSNRTKGVQTHQKTDLENEVERLSTEKEELYQKLQETVRQNNDDVYQLREEKRNLKEQLDETRRGLEKSLRDASEQKEHLYQRLTSIQSEKSNEFHRLQKENESLTRNNEHMEDRLETAENKRRRIEHSNADLRERLSGLEEHLAQTERRLQEVMRYADYDITNWRFQLRNLSLEKEELQKKLQELNASNKEKDRSLRTMQRELDNAHSDAEHVLKEKENLQKTNQAYSNQIQTLSEHFAEPRGTKHSNAVEPVVEESSSRNYSPESDKNENLNRLLSSHLEGVKGDFKIFLRLLKGESAICSPQQEVSSQTFGSPEGSDRSSKISEASYRQLRTPLDIRSLHMSTEYRHTSSSQSRREEQLSSKVHETSEALQLDQLH